MTIKVLDCTLRDGGYYTSWKFDNSLINNYLSDIKSSKIDAVELGFRFLSEKEERGPLAYTSEKFLDTLSLPSDIEYAVMINGSEFSCEPDLQSKVDKIFLEKENSQISIVRVAINFNNFKDTRAITELLKKKGYKVGLNLMQVHGKDKIVYSDTAKEISDWGSVDLLYLADSLGVLEPKDISKILKCFKPFWKNRMGIHTHNNRGNALRNSIKAIEGGVTWVDSTICGMGRGAGNTPTEDLLIELKRLNLHDSNPSGLIQSYRGFELLKEKYKWGANIYYHFASQKYIHPTYIQTLLSDPRYNDMQIFEAISSLADNQSSLFSSELLEETFFDLDKNSFKGDWSPSNWLKGKDALLVAAGESAYVNKKKIENFVKKNNLKVFLLNFNKVFPQDLVKATIVCNDSKALLDSTSYSKLTTPLITPFKSLINLIPKTKNVKLFNYGLILEKNSFEFKENYCKLDSPLVAAYALGIMHKAKVNNLYLAGFDGYKDNPGLNEQMEEIFIKYKNLNNPPDLLSLTPTLYKGINKLKLV